MVLSVLARASNNYYCYITPQAMPAPINLEELTKEELNDFLASFDNIFCDCDGVLYHVYQMLNGSKEAINFLRERGKNVKFITNNIATGLTSDALNKGGITIYKDSIINPIVALVEYLRSINFKKEVFVIGLPVLKKNLCEEGIQVSQDSYEYQTYENLQHFIKSATNELNDKVGAVIVCLDFNMTYSHINRAARYAEKKDVQLLFTGSDKKIPIGKEKCCLGPGYFQDLLALSSKKKPLCFGKPSMDFQDYLKKKLKFDSKRTLFIGDSLVNDISFANEMGFKSLLCLSGASALEDLDNCDEKFLPQYYVKSLGHLYKLM